MNVTIKQRIDTIRQKHIPNGYCINKRGHIAPNDWRDTKIGTLIQFHKEKSTLKNQYPVLTSARSGLHFQKEYFDGQVTTDDNEGYNVLPYGYYTYRSRSDDGTFYFNKNTIVEKGLISCFYPVFHFYHDIAYEYFVFSCMNELLKEQIYCEVAGTSQQVLSENALSAMRVMLPPLSEQRKIVEILGCCDEVIRLKKELIAEKKKQKKALMQKLLDPNSGFRLPGFSGRWEQKKLKTVCFVNIKMLGEKTDPGFEFRYIDITSIDCGKLLNIPEIITFANAPCRARRCFKRGDILLSTVRPYLQGFLFVDFDSSKYIASTGFSILSAKDDNCSKFIYHQLFSTHITLQIQNFLTGTNYPALNGDDVNNLIFNMPPTLKEQQAIADILSAADREIDLFEQELMQHEKKKKALMQLLLSGIVRCE